MCIALVWNSSVRVLEAITSRRVALGVVVVLIIVLFVDRVTRLIVLCARLLIRICPMALE